MAVSKFLDPKNDIAFKKIFSSEKNKDILIHFINDIMAFKDEEQIQDVTFLSPVQDPDVAYKKQSLVDVLCEAQDGTQIIVEMQVSPSRGFEKRAQYYAAKAYSRQLSQGQSPDGLYTNLREVIFIAISDCIIFPDKNDYISHHVILDTITFEHDLRDFYFTFIELPKFNKSKEELTTIEDKWYYFFKHAHKTRDEDLAGIIGGDNIIRRAYDELNQFHWNEKELLAYEEMKRVEMDNNAALDQKLDDARAEGMFTAKVEIAKNLLKSGISIELVAKSTGLTIKEIDLIKDK